MKRTITFFFPLDSSHLDRERFLFARGYRAWEFTHLYGRRGYEVYHNA